MGTPADPRRLVPLAIATAFAMLACSSDEGPGAVSPVDTSEQADTAPDVSDDTSAADTTVVDTVVAPAAPYSVTVFDSIRISGLDGFNAVFRTADGDVSFPGGPFAKATLVVELTTSCYPFELWAEDPPPEGHNWPPHCDAFDRKFELSLNPPGDEPDAPPAIELARAITPFGGPLTFDVDVTDVVNGIGEGPHTLRAFIDTWPDNAGLVSGSQGGWNVTARFDLEPGPPPRPVLAVLPLFNGQLAGSDDGKERLDVSFDVPEGVAYSLLEYRITGHGGGTDAGCIGPAEEFCQRIHTLTVDGVPAATERPWRADCDTLCTLTHQGPPDGGFDYCLENPTGAIASVNAPRANWCPGDVTPPLVYDFEAYRSPGSHRFEADVDRIAPGGHWRTSARVIVYGAGAISR